MLQIFKYFFGIIGVLILVYVLIVVLRTIFSSGFGNSVQTISDPAVQNNIASGTKDLANAVGQFSLANWLRNFRPFAYAPLEVTTDVTDRLRPKYYNDDLEKYDGYYGNTAWRENLNWQDLGRAPDRHPTDFVPIGDAYYEQLLYANENQNNREPNFSGNNLKASDKYIKPHTRAGSIVKNNSLLTGSAFFKVFTLGKFPIYILDQEGNTVGVVTAFANGDVEKDNSAPFRAVIDLDNINIRQGFLMYKNENLEISGIKAVTVVPVLFQK